MSGYLHFKMTGVDIIDAIGKALKNAGDAYHNTADWRDTGRHSQPNEFQIISGTLSAAASELESLQAQLSDANKALKSITLKEGYIGNVPSPWISVDDRLPEDLVDVLGLWRNRAFVIAVVSDGEWLGHDGDITHWTPIPPTTHIHADEVEK